MHFKKTFQGGKSLIAVCVTRIDMNWSLSESMPCGKSTTAVKSWKSLVMWRNADVHMSHCKDQLFNGAIHSINGPSPCQSRVLTCWNLRCGFLMLFAVWQYSLQLQSQCRFPMYRFIDLRNHFMAVLVCWSRTKRKNLSVLAPLVLLACPNSTPIPCIKTAVPRFFVLLTRSRSWLPRVCWGCWR